VWWEEPYLKEGGGNPCAMVGIVTLPGSQQIMEEPPSSDEEEEEGGQPKAQGVLGMIRPASPPAAQLRDVM
jgi:hypothetical protein